MVGPLLLLKLMHCKKKCQTHAQKKETGSDAFSKAGQTQGSSDSRSFICRVCLKDGVIPIFAKNKLKDIPEALAVFGGIEVKKNDDYPKYLCTSCHALLQGAMIFRKTAQESDEILKNPAKEHQDEEGDDLFDGMELDEDAFDFHIPVENENLMNHLNHQRINPCCTQCDINFDTLKEYHEHRLSEEHETRRRSCPICKKSLSALYFKKHLQLHTLETPTHMCDICGKTFIVYGQFKRHRLTHFYELPFKCSQCPYRGRFTESLRLHMRIHTGEKPYQCSQCAAQFVNKSNLNKHMRTHAAHNYKCEMCGRGFYTKKNLDMHLKVDHNGIKEHECNICGKAFGYRKQMMKHQLKVHKRQKLKRGRLPLYLQVAAMRENEESESSVKT